MKILKYSLLICILITFSMCTPDDGGSFGNSVNRTDQIVGTWQIKSVSQIDLDAEKKSFPEYATKVDITNAITSMPFSDFSMELTNGAITTVLGTSPMAYVIEQGAGTWKWITNDEINLVNQELGINAVSGLRTMINNNQVDLYVSTFAGIIGTSPTLSLEYTRKDNLGNDVMRYEYIFSKQ